LGVSIAKVRGGSHHKAGEAEVQSANASKNLRDSGDGSLVCPHRVVRFDC